MNNRRILVISLLAILLLAACGGGASSGGGAQSGGASPADVVRSAYQIMFTGEGDIAPLVCSAFVSEVERMQASFAQMAQTGAEIDISGLTFTTQNESGDTAEVVVAGNIKMTVAGAETETPFPPTTMITRNENGWKVCGGG